MFIRLTTLLSFFLFFNYSYAKVCKIPIIKSFKDLKEKIKICDKGYKIYLNYDIKLIGEEFVVSFCSLKDTIIFKEESKILHKRKSGASIICIFDPDLELFN